MTCKDRFILKTDGNLRSDVIWDYANIIMVLIPGTFLIRMCPDRLRDLQREPGVLEVSPMKDES